ncbi:unnamed protein product [Cyprideis torosa]|uniref:Uncharacterized protein n=1 Tax=Cyprideis torosa TaxID=163714 RepID=A0A7R8WGP7_9CRUS|nr:unnamed protein product [Cyprideis torosa]CAG0898444.1 unnamed protein product [Cyprideis torosa]
MFAKIVGNIVGIFMDGFIREFFIMFLVDGIREYFDSKGNEMSLPDLNSTWDNEEATEVELLKDGGIKFETVLKFKRIEASYEFRFAILGRVIEEANIYLELRRPSFLIQVRVIPDPGQSFLIQSTVIPDQGQSESSLIKVRGIVWPTLPTWLVDTEGPVAKNQLKIQNFQLRDRGWVTFDIEHPGSGIRLRDYIYRPMADVVANLYLEPVFSMLKSQTVAFIERSILGNSVFKGNEVDDFMKGNEVDDVMAPEAADDASPAVRAEPSVPDAPTRLPSPSNWVSELTESAKSMLPLASSFWKSLLEPKITDAFQELLEVESDEEESSEVIETSPTTADSQETLTPSEEPQVTESAPTQRTGLPDDRTGLADDRTGLLDDRTGLPDDRTGLPIDRTGLLDDTKPNLDSSEADVPESVMMEESFIPLDSSLWKSLFKNGTLQNTPGATR